MTFLPNNYEVPKPPSDYMNLEIGKNHFRILTDAVIGWKYWNTENKPIRSKEPFDFIPDDIQVRDGRMTDIQHFWAFVVWNYKEGRIQILEIVQPGIQRTLKTKIENRNGIATNADIVITRNGSGRDTKYDTDMLDSSPTSPEILAAFNAKPINLEALYTGGNPFETDASHATQLKKEEPEIAPDIQEQAEQMEQEAQEMAKDIPF